MKIPALAAVVALILSAPARGQDIPGFSLGGIFEYRVENKIGDDDLAFTFYGVRLAVRDERWVEIFLEGGGQRMSFDPFRNETAAAFGLGGTLWLTRGDPGWGPVDLGLLAAGYFADYSTVRLRDSALRSDVKHYRGLVQLAVRGHINPEFRAFVRGGIQYSELDPARSEFKAELDSGDLSRTRPAINAGVELELVEDLVATLELNFSESVGGAVRLGYWF